MGEEKNQIKLQVSKSGDNFKILSVDEEARVRIVKKLFEIIEIQLDKAIKNKKVPSKRILDTISTLKDLIIEN